MVVDPIESGLANPVELMVATLGTLDDQAVDVVTSPKLPSEKVAVAVNCSVWFCDNEMLAFVGLIASAVTVLLLTVRVALAVTLLVDVAVMVLAPSATPVAKPEVLMVAMPLWDEVQVTDEVTSPVLLSPKVAVAVYCSVASGMMKAPVGEMESETMVSLDGKKPPEQLPNESASKTATSALM
jgi:hypothetical protein